MKAIKYCAWEIQIGYSNNIFCYNWWAWALNVGFVSPLKSSYYNYKTKRSAKRSWERFAKLNRIKKWKYV